MNYVVSTYAKAAKQANQHPAFSMAMPSPDGIKLISERAPLSAANNVCIQIVSIKKKVEKKKTKKVLVGEPLLKFNKNEWQADRLAFHNWFIATFLFLSLCVNLSGSRSEKITAIVVFCVFTKVTHCSILEIMLVSLANPKC